MEIYKEKQSWVTQWNQQLKEHREDEFLKMHKILFAGTIIFSGCSCITLNLGEEYYKLAPSSFIEYFTRIIEYFAIIHLADRLKDTLIKFLATQSWMELFIP